MRRNQASQRSVFGIYTYAMALLALQKFFFSSFRTRNSGNHRERNDNEISRGKGDASFHGFKPCLSSFARFISRRPVGRWWKRNRWHSRSRDDGLVGTKEEAAVDRDSRCTIQAAISIPVWTSGLVHTGHARGCATQDSCLHLSSFAGILEASFRHPIDRLFLSVVRPRSCIQLTSIPLSANFPAATPSLLPFIAKHPLRRFIHLRPCSSFRLSAPSHPPFHHFTSIHLRRPWWWWLRR